MAKSLALALLCASAAAFSPALAPRRGGVRMAAAVGDKFPSVELDYLFPPTKAREKTSTARADGSALTRARARAPSPPRARPPAQVNMEARLAGKKTIIVGLPGAFTPT